ncbi:MAG: hypothetical protein PHD21_01700 [Flavobacteriales bacterium]|nr:hypothetical protein [Flavobacteriales bacterium]
MNSNSREKRFFKEKPLECPVCASKQIADVLCSDAYLNDELKEKIVQGKVIFVGSDVQETEALWECCGCHTKFYHHLNTDDMDCCMHDIVLFSDK